MAFSTPKAEHINPFLNATILAFDTMVGIKIKPDKPYLKKGGGVHYDVSGIIGLSGNVKGSIIMSFPKETAFNVVSAFIGERVSSMNADVTDAIGELANIVAGAAKKDLTEYKITISLPTVIIGAKHDIFEPKDTKCMIIPFKTDSGNFDLAINLKSEN